MISINLILDKNPHWNNQNFPAQNFKRNLFPELVSALPHRPMIYLTGPRRVGKTEIIFQLINQLIENGVPNKQILFFDFNPNDKVEDLEQLWEYFQNNVANRSERMYFFCDEIQYLDKYENSLKLLYDTYPKLKLIVTGSLSLSFKRRMEESLAGRFFAFKLGHLSFDEYLGLAIPEKKQRFMEAQNSTDLFLRQSIAKEYNFDFQNFLQFYRYPELCSLKDSKLIKLYLNSIIDQSLNQDALNYFNLQKPAQLSALLKYIINHNGQEISQNNLAQNMEISRNTVREYLDVLELLNIIKIIYNTTNPLQQGSRLTKIYTNSSFGLTSDLKPDNLGYLVESYILDRLYEKDCIPTFFRNRNKEVDFVLGVLDQAIEVKYLTQIPTLGDFESYLKQNKFQGKLITQYQTINDTKNEIEYIPACLF